MLTMGMLVVTSCSDVEFFNSEESDEIVRMTYTIGINDDAQGRAIGDGYNVDKLYVGVYENGEEVKRVIGNISDKEAQITIELFKNHTYDLVFWAQSSQTDVYDKADLRNVGITYPASMTLQEAARMDAFFLLKEGVTVTEMEMDGGELTLKRPFAQLNIAASEEDAPEKIKKAVLTVQYKDEEPLVLTYTDFAVEEGDKITCKENEMDYYYVATAFLKPGIIKGDVVLYDESGNEMKKFDLNQGEHLELKANYRYNVLGDMITSEELSGWDGIIPVEFPLTSDEENRYVIDEEIDLAWLSVEENASTLAEGSTFIVTKDVLNMGSQPISSIQLPAGSTFDGSGKTIKNFANSLFGNAVNLTVRNLTLDKVVATSEGHVGVLVNTLTGNSSFTGVTITNSSATTTDGAAGGMVGYIVRNTIDNRNETLTVTFSNCNLVDITADGTQSEGKFVGLLSGYDNGETLSFDAECSAENTSITDYTSSYLAENQSVWLNAVDSKYDGWLGTETYRRGVVKFEDKRLVPKWDGTTTVEPLLANEAYDGANAVAGENKFVVYSPFDLAGVRKKTASPAAIYLKADIDMNGQGADGEYNVPSNFTQSAYSSTDDNVFDPFNYVTTLDGYKDEDENYSIYNLSIEQIAQERAAFILYASGTTTHKNINFRNCQTVAVHKEVATDAKAYGAILVSNVDATYTMENVHAYNCKVFALQKVGTLGARISGTSTLKNNSVNNCYVENYECNISEYFTSGDRDIAGYLVDCHENFFPHGEVGGMFGFIQGNSKISNCNVNSTEIYGFGQNDKKAKFTIKDKNGEELHWLLQVTANIAVNATGLYLIPGRHVGTLIGDIRATGTITIDNSGNIGSQCLNRQDKHNNTYDYIGQCYYVRFLDSVGSVTVDGKALTLADCNSNTKR